MPAHFAPDNLAVPYQLGYVMAAVRQFARSWNAFSFVEAAWQLSLLSQQLDGTSSKHPGSMILRQLCFPKLSISYLEFALFKQGPLRVPKRIGWISL